MIKRVLIAAFALMLCVVSVLPVAAADREYLATVKTIDVYYDAKSEKVCFDIVFDGIVLDTHSFTVTVRCEQKGEDGSFGEASMFGMHTLKFTDCLEGDSVLKGQVALGKSYYQSSSYRNWDVVINGRQLSTSGSGETYSINTVTAPVMAQMLGDANGDGKVNSLDAAWALRYDAGLQPVIGNCDVTRDGKISSLDAAFILRFDASLIKHF